MSNEATDNGGQALRWLRAHKGIGLVKFAVDLQHHQVKRLRVGTDRFVAYRRSRNGQCRRWIVLGEHCHQRVAHLLRPR